MIYDLVITMYLRCLGGAVYHLCFLCIHLCFLFKGWVLALLFRLLDWAIYCLVYYSTICMNNLPSPFRGIWH